MAALAALLVHIVALALIWAPHPARRPPAGAGGAVKLFALPQPEALPRASSAPEAVPMHAPPIARARIAAPAAPSLLPAAPVAPGASSPAASQASLSFPDAVATMNVAPPSASPPVRGTDRPDAARAAYVRLLWQQIAQRRPAGISLAGSCTISFRLDGQGRLISAEISQASGNMLLDKLALRTVRQAAPYPAPPATVADGGLLFSIPFSFR